MTKQQFIEKYRYELAGLVFDFAMTERSGGERALQFRTVMGRVDRMLTDAWDATNAPAEESKPASRK